MSTCCTPTAPTSSCTATPLAWFEASLSHCLEYVRSEHSQGRPIVGIMCEYTPRELILAAGATPVCLCGGAQETIVDAETVLPVNLCPLIKSTFGFHVRRANPFLEIAALLVGETTCDGKKKMYEYMAQSRPMHILELPQKQNTPGGLDFWTCELRSFKAELERRFDTAITEESLRAAIAAMNRERALRRELAALMARDAPPLTGRQLLQLRSAVSGIPLVIEKLEAALEYLRTAPVCEKSRRERVRVLLTGVPVVQGAERVVDLVEDHGGLIVCMENCTGVKPILEDVAVDAPDPIRALAEKYFHLPCPVMTPNVARLESLRSLIADYRVEAVIELVWVACQTYDVESRGIKRLAEEELGIPYLRIETDYSPSDSARIAVRVEALMETARQR